MSPRALVTFTSRLRHLRECGGPVFLLPAHFPSVFFRVIPWLMLLLLPLLILLSVAMLLLSCNLRPNMDISEILQPYEGGFDATPASVNAGVLGQIQLRFPLVNHFV